MLVLARCVWSALLLGGLTCLALGAGFYLRAQHLADALVRGVPTEGRSAIAVVIGASGLLYVVAPAHGLLDSGSMILCTSGATLVGVLVWLW